MALKRTGLRHKAVNGGLVLDVDDETAVQQAYRRLERHRARRADGRARHRAAGRGPARRRRARARRRARRRLHRAARPVAIVPLPVTGARVKQALRHRSALDAPDAVATLATKLAELPLALIELNPVIVRAHGAVAVDALADQEVLTP